MGQNKWMLHTSSIASIGNWDTARSNTPYIALKDLEETGTNLKYYSCAARDDLLDEIGRRRGGVSMSSHENRQI